MGSTVTLCHRAGEEFPEVTPSPKSPDHTDLGKVSGNFSAPASIAFVAPGHAAVLGREEGAGESSARDPQPRGWALRTIPQSWKSIFGCEHVRNQLLTEPRTRTFGTTLAWSPCHPNGKRGFTFQVTTGVLQLSNARETHSSGMSSTPPPAPPANQELNNPPAAGASAFHVPLSPKRMSCSSF